MTINTITARIWWDTQDPNNTGWAWNTRVDGSHDDSGPLDGLPRDASEDELVEALYAQVLSKEAKEALSRDDIEVDMTVPCEETRLHLWVSNQEGVNYDATEAYLKNAGCTPSGVNLDGQILSGDDPETVYRAFLELAEAVARAGHGDDIPGEPVLTACPAEEAAACTGQNYVDANESMRRITSGECSTYAEWMRR